MAKTEVKKEVKETVEAPKKEKKPRKPREKVRPIEVIYDLSVNKLTEKEKDSLIKHLRENTVLLKNQVHQYKQNAEGAFERARDVEQKYDAMERYYIDGFNEINLQLSAFGKSIRRVTGGAQ